MSNIAAIIICIYYLDAEFVYLCVGILVIAIIATKDEYKYDHENQPIGSAGRITVFYH